MRTKIPVAEDGFYDDFPPEIIKEFGLRVSTKIKSPIYKRQKLSETQDAKKSLPALIDKPMPQDLNKPNNSQNDQISESEIKKDNSTKELGLNQSVTDNS